MSTSNMDVDTSWRDMTKEEYTPVIVELPKQNDKDPFDKPIEPIFEVSVPYPKAELGFHHFFHQSRANTFVYNKFQGKKRVYRVLNKFEHLVDDTNDDIHGVSPKFLKLPKGIVVLSRAHHKMWEILMQFDLLPDNRSIVGAHLAEGPGGFIQATMNYRDLYNSKYSKGDRFYGITIHTGGKSLDMNQRFIDYYEKEKPQRLYITKTHHPREVTKSSNKTDGDLTKLSTIKHFAKQFSGKKADLVTGDGGFIWKEELLQEQEVMALVMGQILAALKVQAKGGSFVLKIFETFTLPMMELLAIVSLFYDKLYIHKPVTSRISNSERYIVGIGFKEPKGYAQKITHLEHLLEDLSGSMKEGKFIQKIFPEYEVPKEFVSAMIIQNNLISNHQFARINESLVFIKDQNYRGDVYKERREEQLEANKFWIDKYYVDPKKYPTGKKPILTQTQELIKENKEQSDRLTRLRK